MRWDEPRDEKKVGPVRAESFSQTRSEGEMIMFLHSFVVIVANKLAKWRSLVQKPGVEFEFEIWQRSRIWAGVDLKLKMKKIYLVVWVWLTQAKMILSVLRVPAIKLYDFKFRLGVTEKCLCSRIGRHRNRNIIIRVYTDWFI